LKISQKIFYIAVFSLAEINKVASELNQGVDKAEANFSVRKNAISAGGRRKL
jgi:hypothetical protein